MANSENRCSCCWQTSADRGRLREVLGNTYTHDLHHHHHHQPVDVIVKSSSASPLRCSDPTLRDVAGDDIGSSAIELNGRFHRLANTVRHDFGAVYAMIKVIDDKLHGLEEYFVRARHQEKWSAISGTAQTDSIRLDQIAAKCDQILKRLDVVEGKLDSSSTVDVSKQATESLDDISAQLNRISKDVQRLVNSAEPHSSKAKHVTLVTETPVPTKPLHAKMFTLNRKHRISSFLTPRTTTKDNNEALIPKINSAAKSAQTKQVTPQDDSLSEQTLSHCATRLRDPKVMNTVRIFLAFLHDQPSTSIYDGMSCTSARMFLALEGFPVQPPTLKQVYLKVHEMNGIGREAVLADLDAYRSYIASERIQRMQRARESTDKFYGRNCAKPK